MSVLVVDGDELARAVATHSLRQAGLAVDAVATGAEAQGALAEGAPATLLLLDPVLPDVAPAELMAQLCAWADPPLETIVLGLGGGDDVAWASLGAVGRIDKPLAVRLLRARVAEVLSAQPRALELPHRTLRRLAVSKTEYTTMLAELSEELRGLGARLDGADADGTLGPRLALVAARAAALGARGLVRALESGVSLASPHLAACRLRRQAGLLLEETERLARQSIYASAPL